MSALPALRLKRHEDKRLRAGHTWVFSNEVDTISTPLNRFAAGDLAQVIAHDERSLGIGYVNPASLICARLLSTDREPDGEWFAARLRAALALRERCYPTPHYRWVYGESDGLPGLVIDRFNNTCVAQIATAGMQRLAAMIFSAVRAVLPGIAILAKNDGALRALEGLASEVAWIDSPGDDPASVVEGTLSFRSPLVDGQKTGWFYDQAANRALLGGFIRAGDTMLDAFSYVGAWAVRGASCGARVVCVDSSAQALEFARANAELNGHSIDTRQGDAFDVLKALCAEGQRFNVVVVDPPAFAKRKKDHAAALQAYRRLNQLAMRVLDEDGILVSCCCSFHVSEEELQEAIAKAAYAEGRRLQILAYGGQAMDHPVHPCIAESRYLKAIFCRVTGHSP